MTAWSGHSPVQYLQTYPTLELISGQTFLLKLIEINNAIAIVSTTCLMDAVPVGNTAASIKKHTTP